MSSRSRLYTRFRHQNNTHSIKKTHLVIFDIDVDYSMLSDLTIEMNIFNEDEIDLWFDYITSDVNEIYLIVSNLLDPQYRNYSNTLTKLQGTFDDINVMWQQFQHNYNIFYSYYDFKQSTFKNIDSKSAESIWWTVFNKILQHIKHTDIAKDEFIGFCRNSVGDDEHQLRDIQELVDRYGSTGAIYWYTKDSFLFILLNRTLRTEKNINNIFKLRLFITDLISQLRNLQSDQRNIANHSILVYRSQLMSIKEIQQFKSAIGNSIRFNHFLSTSLDGEVALTFTGSSGDNSDIASVLMTIELDSNSINNNIAPFAKISTHSYFGDEEEVLLSMNSILLIESVELDENHRWNARLKYIDNQWDVEFDERRRQNVASFLTKDLGIDWRYGAVWFESILIDHDVCSNYGNWIYVAGVGTDPRENRHFNVVKQGFDYDPNGIFVRIWCPELARLPNEYIQTPWLAPAHILKEAGVELGVHYPRPIIIVPQWNQQFQNRRKSIQNQHHTQQRGINFYFKNHEKR
ncbi:unnamed protein product [Adineta steineri]|uniref:Uncharacterized protein n=1 Tax=Adineta steineri TaxID=433720 RepID=A0A813N9M2_9BILA|nr:unnamed protein product [Adineta steineri]